MTEGTENAEITRRINKLIYNIFYMEQAGG